MPKYRHSLSFRIIVGFSTMGLVLIAVYVFFLYWMLSNFEKNREMNKMKHDLRFYIDAYAEDINARFVHPPNLNSYVGSDNLPDKLKALLASQGPGFYRTGKKGIGGDRGYMIAIAKIPGRDKLLFLVHNDRHPSFVSKRIRGMNFILILVAGAVIILGAGLSFLLSKRVIAPLSQLVKTVEGAGPDHLPTDISPVYHNDEVGALARAFENAMERIKKFVEREREFTRDSSHELRSPLTVIKGSLALLKMRVPDDEKSQEAIQRIGRAVDSMMNTVDCFLWLAREESGAMPHDTFSVADVVRHEFEACSFLVDKRDVKVEFIKRDDPEYTGPVHLFSIVVSNLIRNAIRYTDRGHIKIIVHHDRIEVSDTGIGIDSARLAHLHEPHQKGEQSTGFGLGLHIVRSLSDRFGWKFTIQSEKGEGATAELYFSPKRSMNEPPPA